jgi:F-type H+-transporting ATPase subunit b
MSMRSLRNQAVSFAVALSLALSSLPVWAAEGAEGGGLPQLDTTLYPEQLFWLAVTFGVLYLLMAYVALPRVASAKDNRSKVIASELDTARKASDAAKASVVTLEKSLAEARDKAMAKTNAQMSEAAAEAYDRQAAKERELVRHLHSVEADIAVAREAALQAISGSAAELASVIVEKCIGSRKRMSS